MEDNLLYLIKKLRNNTESNLLDLVAKLRKEKIKEISYEYVTNKELIEYNKKLILENKKLKQQIITLKK